MNDTPINPRRSSVTRKHRALIWFCLVALTAIIYGRSVRYGFVQFDDNDLYSRQFVPRSFFGAPGRRIWSESTFGNWQPIVTLTVVADRHLNNLNPHWMHAEDALLHALCGIAVFEFLRRATRRTGPSAWVAALFIVAPMHVESVAWLSERKDEMAALFFFLSLWTYSTYVPRRSWGWYCTSIIAAALSLICKPMAVTLAPVMLLLDYWPLRRMPLAATDKAISWRTLLLEKIPFVLLAAMSAAIAVMTQQTAGRSAGVAVYLPIVARLSNAMVCYVLYAGKLLVPIGLAVFYPHPGQRPMSSVLAATGLLLIVTIGIVRQRHRRPYLLVGWLWFLGTLVPVIGIMQIGAQAMADRYSYIPSIGIFIIVVWGANELLNRLPRPLLFKTTLGLAAVVAYAIIAFVQVGYWKNTQTLFTHTAEVTSNNPVADLELGIVALRQDDPTLAAAYYADAIRISPRNPHGYSGLAACVVAFNPHRAADLLQMAVKNGPLTPAYRLQLADALWRAGEPAAALAAARRALSLDPTNPQAQATVRSYLIKHHQHDHDH